MKAFKGNQTEFLAGRQVRLAAPGGNAPLPHK